MRERWDVIPQINHLFKKHFKKVAQTAARNPDRPVWFVPTEDGNIRVPNTNKAPFGVIYDIATAPTQLIGGPTPLSLGLLGVIYGGLLGGGLGTLAMGLGLGSDEDSILGRLLRRAAIVGAIIGAIPGAAIGIRRMLYTPEGQSAWRGWIEPWPVKKAQTDFGLVPGEPIYEPQWRDIILNDPLLTNKEKAIAAAPVYAASMATGRSVVTPAEVAAVAGNTILGAAFGRILANIAGAVLGMSPENRQLIQQSGALAGAIKGVVRAF
jgi:hypothetical protein